MLEANPEPLVNIAGKYGIENFIVWGLCNDELGYIIPPSDHLLDGEYPYLSEVRDQLDRGHYEETNSVGINCAYEIANAFEEALANVG